nr:hypothetical protein OH837_48330 [Streptomyces canus]
MDDPLFFTSDERGRAPVFRRDPDGVVTRLTASGAYGSLTVGPDGRTLYARRHAVGAPPTPVRIDADVVDQTPAAVPAPGGVGELPGTLTEVHAEADDGFVLRGWLVLPEGAYAEQPAPLLVAVHRGPQRAHYVPALDRRQPRRLLHPSRGQYDVRRNSRSWKMHR